MCIFFFFKQKTSYEMRISDWSSDVCSSDLFRPWGGRASMCGCRRIIEKLRLPMAHHRRSGRTGGGGSARGLQARGRYALRTFPDRQRTRRRSEERSDGQEGDSKCRSRWSTDHQHKKKKENTDWKDEK